MTGATGFGLITILRFFASLPAVFAALTVKLNVPAIEGKPEITPVVPFKLNPTGRLPAETDQVIGVVPLALRA